MCKRFLKCNHTLFVITALALFTLALLGCKKQIDQTTKTDINSSPLVTMEQIKQWAASFLPTIADQPTLAYELTQKKMVNGRSYVRVPTYGVGSEGGFFYFTKNADGSLQSLYVLTDQKDKTKPDGTVSFVDFDNKTYTLATYQNNKPFALYSLKDNKGFFEGVFTNKQTGFIRKRVDDACAEQTSTIKLPDGKDSIIIKKVNGGIECPGYQTIWQKIGKFFSSVWDGVTDAFDWLFGWMSGGGGSEYLGGAFGSGGYSSWNFTDFWGLYGVGAGCTNCSSDPAGGGWAPYNPWNNGSTVNYNDFNRTEDDIETGDTDNNPDGYVDNLAFSDYDYQTQPWPTIQNVIPVSLFVGWNRPLHPYWECFDYAKAQIRIFNYFPDNYYNNRGNTIQVYKEGIINNNSVKNGVGYIVEALKAGIPVIVGVDDQAGSPNPQTDNTTDHFIVIVGTGTDAKGNYFSFYDNASGDPIQGTSTENKLYYNPSTGMITGKSQTDYAKASFRHDYIVTMIRKSLKK